MKKMPTKSAIIILLITTICINVSAQNFLADIKKTSFKSDTLNIVSFGAKNDGLYLNTKSINDAITVCSYKGGGVVLVPPGMWLTGPVVLKDNVNLHLASNSILQFTKDFSQFALVPGNWEGVPQMRNQSPISATNATNIAITGSGIVDGNGDAWRMVKKDKLNETQWKKLVASGGLLSEDKKTWYPSETSYKGSGLNNPGVISSEKDSNFYKSVKEFLRPNMVVLTSCSRVLLEGVTFQNSPAWNLHPLMCDNLIIKNIYAKNPWYAQNGDGVDVESCKNVLIEGSTFDVGDDGICIKSGKDEAGRKRGTPTENILVRNCTVYHAHGGFVIGSEMSGGAKNLFVEHCTFIGTDIGLRFKTTRGRGGIVEKIFISDIVMKDIVGDAILFDMYYAAQDPIALIGDKRVTPKVELFPVSDATPRFQDFHVRNIVCNGASRAVFIRGLPEMHISNINLENIIIQSSDGIDISEASNINFTNVKVLATAKYPLINISNAENLTFNNFQYGNAANPIFNITGERSKAIIVTNSKMPSVKQAGKFDQGALENSLIIK